MRKFDIALLIGFALAIAAIAILGVIISRNGTKCLTNPVEYYQMLTNRTCRCNGKELLNLSYMLS